MTLLEDLVMYLTNLGLIHGDGVDTYRDFQPETPDDIVSLHEYKGDPISPYTDVVHRSVQIIVRSRRAVDAQALSIKLCKAFQASDETMRIDFTPTRWGQVHIRQHPFKLTQDNSDRVHYCFNLGITTTTD